jgi:RsiW-degrading membrane proteinase PrsW (M82 family)
MLSVPFAIILELWVIKVAGYSDITEIINQNHNLIFIFVMILWAMIEEILKFAFGMRELVQKEDDEPVDPAIYMITTALGFAALENVLFIISPLFSGDFLHVAAATQMRFVGATLVHVLGSGIIGVTMGFVFYKSKFTKILFLTIAACGAIVLHAFFNIFIMFYESHIFLIFATIWVLIVGLILAVERLKFIKK